MCNFVYLIGDCIIGDCVVVDLVYVVGDLFDVFEFDDMQLLGVLVIYYYLDYVGGLMMGFQLLGLVELLEWVFVFVYVNIYEVLWVL